jgi:hypothetical protein
VHRRARATSPPARGIEPDVEVRRLGTDIGVADRYYRRFEFPDLTCQIGLLLGACCLSLRSFAFEETRRTRAGKALLSLVH